MPFDWSAYLPLAADLATRVDDEAAARSAVSRAYYAALHQANELLALEGIAVSPLRIHFQARRAFQASRDPRRAAIGADLDWLRQKRLLADYAAILDDDPTALSRAAVRRAGNVLRALDDLRSISA